MPQPGIHAVLALATRKTFSKKRWFAFGLVLGALLPDLDGYAQAYGFLVQGISNEAAAAIYHRTLTHSLFFAAAIALLFYLLSLWRGNAELNYLGLGMATGIALLHSFVDIFAWFDGVGLLWPIWQINLWSGVIVSESVARLLRSANFLAFGWYFAYLLSLAGRVGMDRAYLPAPAPVYGPAVWPGGCVQRAGLCAARGTV